MDLRSKDAIEIQALEKRVKELEEELKQIKDAESSKDN